MTTTARQLHPDWVALLAQLEAAQMPAVADLTPEQAREVVKAFKDLQGAPEEVAAVRDIEIPGPLGPIPARVYTPAGSGPFGAIAYIHGGGFVTGTLDVGDNACRSLANACGAVIVAVDYRLAPEHKFPAPLEDCYSAVAWISANAAELDIDADRLAVLGDSAGGNLAASVALLARDRGARPGRADPGVPRDRAAVGSGLRVAARERHRLPAHPGGHAVVLGPLPLRRLGSHSSLRCAVVRRERRGAAAFADSHGRVRRAAQRG